MARLPRLAIDHQLHHLVHRAAPGTAVCLVDEDRLDLIGALLEVSRDAGVAIHAYALLPDRLHLLLTPRRGAELASLMQRVGRRFVVSFNKRHGRSGSPWAGRYRTGVLQASRYLLDAMAHVEMAAVGAGLVAAPEQWVASSAAHHLGRRHDPLITDHPLFWSLGNTPFERESRYRQRLLDPAASALAAAGEIERATEQGWAIGDADFLEMLEGRQARRLQPLTRGRRRKPVDAGYLSDPI
ncbi:transposase [Piscinibacter sakaiensis]|uniref:transposase n=1 Tax=Piscinibacter sakaiensis TaxID=1547922 RepID=UPI003AAE5E27